MDQFNDSFQLLDLLACPAFAVKDGVIVYVNREAAGYTFCPELCIADMLDTGTEEYANLESGKLYLTLCFQGHPFGAAITRLEHFDLFVLECMDVLPELQTASLAARELREPLSNMLLAMEQLLPTLDIRNPAVCSQAEQMNKNLHRLLRLVGNMSDAVSYAGASVSRQEFRNVTSIVQEIFDKATVLFEQAGITLRFTNLKETVNCMVDAERLERAIYNILSNAAKHTKPGGTVDAIFSKRGSRLLLSIQDNGSGIPDDILGNVFQRHLRTPSLEDSSQGIGLGMVLIRGAATAHGGTVLVQRMPQGGTQVTMTLSIRKLPDGSLASPILRIDYAGSFDHALTELSDVLPQQLYSPLTPLK